MASENNKWVPTTQFGRKGLNTQEDPQFIDDHEMTQCLNVSIDGPQIAPRKGTNLLYTVPTVDINTAEQLFQLVDGQGNEYLSAKYGNHWYVLDPRSSNWLMIGTQVAGDPLYMNTSWHDVYYSFDVYAHADNIAFFAPSDYSVPANDTDPILFWPMGITYLSQDAHIGDTSILVEDLRNFTLAPASVSVPINLNGELVQGVANPVYVDSGTLFAGLATVTGLADTAPIEQGVTVTGPNIPNSTTVASIDSPTQITLSQIVPSVPSTIFNGTGDTTALSDTITNLNLSVSGPFTSGVYGGGFVQYGVQVFGSAVPLAPNTTYYISGTGVPAGTTATLDVVATTAFYVIASLTPSQALTSSTGDTITITNIIEVGAVVTGTGIPSSTTILSLVGAAPLYTGFVMSLPATSSNVTDVLTFTFAPKVQLSFQDTHHIFLSGAQLTSNHSIGDPVTPTLQSTKSIPNFPQGSVVLMWLNSLVVAGAEGAIDFSKPLDPFFSGGFYFVVATISGRINDMRSFGQFFIAGTKDDLEIGQKIASADLNSVGALFTPYLSGQGMGPISPQGTIVFNNTYYYPTSTNGIIALTPNFTGSSSAAGVEVLTDNIHNFIANATFLRTTSFNRKLYWLFSVPATPESPSLNYFLVYDMIRKGFTVNRFSAVDATIFNDTFCIMAPSGSIYQGEVDSYEDRSEGGSGAYLVEAFSKRYDFGEPSLPKESQYVMVQGDILLGTDLFVDVFYNEAGALGKTTYKIEGDTSNPCFTLPGWVPEATSPFALTTFGSGNLAVGKYRTYLELSKNYRAHNYQLRFYTEKAGSYWTVGIVSPNVAVSTIPNELVISPS